MRTALKTNIKTRVVRVSDNTIVKESPWRKNLVLDSGLQQLAHKSGANYTSCNGASGFEYCRVGSGSTPTSYASGGITFTQSGYTVTASGVFFTPAMVGGILKYGSGSGGAEYYITGYTSGTEVTVDTSATVGSPTAGVVWMVHQTVLSNPLYYSNTYQTNAGDNSTTYTGSKVTYKRTFIFARQTSTYTVNEIGYAPHPTNYLVGRIVLPSSDVIDNAHYYVVVIELEFTYSPNVPTAVADVGTGINTAGNAMIEYWNVAYVNSSTGATMAYFTNFESAQTTIVATSTYSQQASIQTSATTSFATYLQLSAGNISWVNAAGIGNMEMSISYSLTTAGQTCYGVALSTGDAYPVFDIKFTTPFTLPTGTFAGVVTWQFSYGRTLVN